MLSNSETGEGEAMLGIHTLRYGRLCWVYYTLRYVHTLRYTTLRYIHTLRYTTLRYTLRRRYTTLRYTLRRRYTPRYTPRERYTYRYTPRERYTTLGTPLGERYTTLGTPLGEVHPLVYTLWYTLRREVHPVYSSPFTRFTVGQLLRLPQA